jgi:hypothetical protein
MSASWSYCFTSGTRLGGPQSRLGHFGRRSECGLYQSPNHHDSSALQDVAWLWNMCRVQQIWQFGHVIKNNKGLSNLSTYTHLHTYIHTHTYTLVHSYIHRLHANIHTCLHTYIYELQSGCTHSYGQRYTRLWTKIPYSWNNIPVITR